MDTATNAPGVICVADVLALIETQCEKLRRRECFFDHEQHRVDGALEALDEIREALQHEALQHQK